MRSIIFVILSLALLNCRHFWGNPYKTALAPRIVPVLMDSLRVEPTNGWTGIKSNKVKILVQRPGIAKYEVRLVKTKGLKILKVEKGDGPNNLFITLEIKENAPEQKAEFVFFKGKNTFTHEFPIRAPNAAPELKKW